MNRGSEEALNKKLLRNRPSALAGLQLVDDSLGGNVRYYIRHPAKGGPQPLLRIANLSRIFEFGGADTFVPKAVERYIANAGGPSLSQEAKSVEWDEPGFSDALTVLPKDYKGRPDAFAFADPVLLAAFSIIASEYEDRIQVWAENREFMARVPATLKEPPFRNSSRMRLAEDACRLVLREDEDARFTPAGRIVERVALKALGWQLWNVEQDRAVTSLNWTRHWHILRAWERWEAFGMTWRERAADLACATKLPRRGDFEAEGEALRKRCERLGLE